MQNSNIMKASLAIATGLILSVSGSAAFAAADANAAKAFAKKNDCFKCHAVDKTKKGPSYQKINAKIKKENIADAKLFEHLTKSSKVKLEDGTEEEHKALDKKDADKINNLIQWIKEQ